MNWILFWLVLTFVLATGALVLVVVGLIQAQQQSEDEIEQRWRDRS